MDKKRKVSKLLIVLGEYLGFSILCGWACTLFFSWCANVFTFNYLEETGEEVLLQTQYWMHLICIFAGIFIAFFVAVLLIQKKFSYIVHISNVVEEMEGGNLAQRIQVEGNDELTDLAVSVNHLAEAMSYNIEETERIAQEKNTTIAALTHDLRTPLTSVVSYLQFIRDGQYQDEEQMQQYVERALDKANLIKELSDHLFQNVLSEQGEENIMERVEGASFFQNVLAEAEAYLEESGFSTEIHSQIEGFLFYIEVNDSMVSRLFENMISNIQKYADAAHPVEFDLELSEGMVLLHQKNKVLEGNRAEVESNLIGLKSVKASLEKMGGTMKVCNSEGEFSLEIQLPIC